jgi:GR25 family glycosyltransferase involved in LPS biosynthesis
MESRQDRRQRITGEFERVGIPLDKITRFPAAPYKDCPVSGCLLSHTTVLEMAYDEGCNNVLILEDDFVFIDDVQKVTKDIDSFFEMKMDWDVLMLTTCSPEVAEKTNTLVSKISSSGNAAAYLVNRSMMLELSALFKANLENLVNTKHHWIYANDVLWKSLMPSSNWFMFNHYLGYQHEGYSDLSHVEKVALIPQIIKSPTSDSIVNNVIDSFIKRSNLGLQKYGTTLDRNDLSVLDWIQHAQEEHMDAILYLEKLKTELIKKPL